MLIEFKINIDGDVATVVQADSTPLPNAPQQKELGPHYHEPDATPSQGGDQPGPGPHGGGGPGSGSGMVFVLGPIVICGSGPSQTSPGGDQPGVGPRSGGSPGAVETTSAQQKLQNARGKKGRRS